MNENRAKTVLGLDIGTNSVGWALIEQNGSGGRIIDMGVHVFPTVVEGDIASGKYETLNKTRREKRLARRLNDRRKRRMRRLMRELQEAGLLPRSQDMARAMLEIDRAWLVKEQQEVPEERLAHVVPYSMRKAALDRKLEPFELGRAVYHLAQRRGFLSNRKSLRRDSEEEGVVKEGISELRREMEAAGARTLGEFFAGLDPEKERIRGRYTHRSMFEEEFNAIWKSQRRFHPELLSEALRKKLYKTIFYQRPLKSQKGLIGRCSLEKDERRCPWYRPEAQEFRILQTVNHLRVVHPEEGERPLRPEERTRLLELLGTRGKMTCSEVRKELGIKGKGVKLNIEIDGEKKIHGNHTEAGLRAIFGDRWDRFSEEEKEKILHDLVSIEKEKTLRRRGKEVWGLSGEALDRFVEWIPEPDYCNLSLKAIRRLLPHLQEGLAYAEAVEKEYGTFFRTSPEPLDSLPPVNEAMGDLRNPVVHRSLTYVRRIVNAVTARYGKPHLISVELAREIKLSKQEKARRTKKISDRTKEREKAAKALKSYGLSREPTREDILKFLLAEECNWTCPYTGKHIGWEDLFGPHPSFDVEHIIPFSISLDDSFLNKTLCHHKENRQVKRNRSPWEAYHGDPEKYEKILQRVRRFKGEAAREKLRRFQLEDLSEFEDFSNRHLNDTRYASRAAMDYLGLLYGGTVDAEGRRRVQAVSGAITVILRRWYGMTGLLGKGEKTREDHRHHAVDALAAALATPASIQALSRASAKGLKPGRIAFREPVEPWKDFIPELKARLATVRTVHHVKRKIRGPLHEETLYSFRETTGETRVRKKLEEMTERDIKNIVDEGVRAAVEEKLEELGLKNNAKKAFSNPENLPVLKNGHVVKSARVRINEHVSEIGSGAGKRMVKLRNNHHAEVVAVLDEAGNETRWEVYVVTMLEAYHRRRECLKEKRPVDVVRRDFGPGRKLKFTLHIGDLLEVDMPNGGRGVFVIRSLAKKQNGKLHELIGVNLNDARKKEEIKYDKSNKDHYLRLVSGQALFKRHAVKLRQTPFGEVRRAND